jgi:hypothetical protein
VHREKRPEPIRANIACDDQQIAWRNAREETVLITQGRNPHCKVPGYIGNDEPPVEGASWHRAPWSTLHLQRTMK